MNLPFRFTVTIIIKKMKVKTQHFHSFECWPREASLSLCLHVKASSAFSKHIGFLIGSGGCVCVCVCVRVCACMRVCVCACVRVCW